MRRNRPSSVEVPRDNFVASIFGQRGAGKTTLAQKIAREYSRVIYLDLLGQYGGDKVYSVEGFCQWAEAKHEDETFEVSIRLDDTDDYLQVLHVAYEIVDYLLVAEETSYFCSPAGMPRELSKIVRYGRHRKISQLYLARRPSELHRDLTAQSDVIVSFYQHEPRDIAYLAACGVENAERVRHLRQFKCAAFGRIETAPLAIIEAMERSGEQQSLKFGETDAAPAPNAGENDIDEPGASEVASGS